MDLGNDDSCRIAPTKTDRAGLRPLLDDPDQAFKTCYNRSTFMFRHGLQGHPLLDLSSLVELGKRLEKHNATYWSNGAVAVGDGWGKGTDNRRPLVVTLENIQDNNSLVILKAVVHDPVVGPIMREVSQAIVDLVGPALREDLTTARASILIASPHRVTAYHIDSDVNFLLQVAGRKLFSVYNHADRSVISDLELERYFSGDQNGAVFKEDQRQQATFHDLSGGFGVHVPSMSPHWAQNGDDVSVAISFNYDLSSIERLARLYRVNHRLRRFGFRPRAPGDTRVRDRAKLAFHHVLSVGRRITTSASTEQDDAGWDPRRPNFYPN